MLNACLAAYLLIVAPAWNMWRSLQPRRDKAPLPLMARYWSMSWHVIVLLSVLGLGAVQAGYTFGQLGLDVPLSGKGAWGLASAVLIMLGLAGIGSLIERRKTPQAQAESEAKLLDSHFPWPTSRAETVAFVASMSLMTAGWEILYRGFILLFLVPYTGLPIAVAASSLAYGMAHGYESRKQLFASIISALVFTSGYALTGSLWWLMLIHAGLPISAIPAIRRARLRRHLSVKKAVHASGQDELRQPNESTG